MLPVFCLCFLCFGLVLLLCFLESLLSPTGQVSVRDKYDSNKSHFTNISSCSQNTCCQFARGLKIQHYCCLALVYGQCMTKLILKINDKQTKRQNTTRDITDKQKHTNTATKTQNRKQRVSGSGNPKSRKTSMLERLLLRCKCR